MNGVGRCSPRPDPVEGAINVGATVWETARAPEITARG